MTILLKLMEQSGSFLFSYQACCFHTGHVVFSSITYMSKSEHDMCIMSFDKVNHGYKGTNGINRNQ